MAGQLISVVGNFPQVEFDTKIPSFNDAANIQEAFLLYHFGVDNFNGSIDTPSPSSIHSHIKVFRELLENISENAVLTISGTENEVFASASAGLVTVGLPESVEINTLTVNDITINGEFILEGGNTTFNTKILAKNGINIFEDANERNSSIPSPIEGTVAYLQNLDQTTIYNGNSWVGVENHGTLGGRIDSTEVLALLGL